MKVGKDYIDCVASAWRAPSWP